VKRLDHITTVDGIDVYVCEPGTEPQAGDLMLGRGMLASHILIKDLIDLRRSNGYPCDRVLVSLTHAHDLARQSVSLRPKMRRGEIAALAYIAACGGIAQCRTDLCPLADCLSLRERGLLELERKGGGFQVRLTDDGRAKAAMRHSDQPATVPAGVVDLAEYRRARR
jgi:hypothetical protein